MHQWLRISAVQHLHQIRRPYTRPPVQFGNLADGRIKNAGDNRQESRRRPLHSQTPEPRATSARPNPACGFDRTGLSSVLCRVRDRVRVDVLMARCADNKRLAPHFCHERGPRGLAWSRRAQLLEAGDLVNCHRGAFVAQLAVPSPECWTQEEFPSGETDRHRAGVGNYRLPVLPQGDPAESRYQIRCPRASALPQSISAGRRL